MMAQRISCRTWINVIHVGMAHGSHIMKFDELMPPSHLTLAKTKSWF